MSDQISVIIPCGGHHAKFIQDAVLSCLRAEPPPDEVIVIDDCVNPPVSESVAKLNGVRSFRLDMHMGRSWARNFGVKQCNSDWLYFLDADDFLEPTAIADFRKIIEEAKVDLIYADYDYVDKNGDRVRVEKKAFIRESDLGKKSGKYIPRWIFYNPVNIGMFVRKERFLAIEGFDEEMAIGEYWDFFIRYTIDPRIKVYKHGRPFFVARQLSSASPNATELMHKATRKIQAMTIGGYYKGWIKK